MCFVSKMLGRASGVATASAPARRVEASRVGTLVTAIMCGSSRVAQDYTEPRSRCGKSPLTRRRLWIHWANCPGAFGEIPRWSHVVRGRVAEADPWRSPLQIARQLSAAASMWKRVPEAPVPRRHSRSPVRAAARGDRRSLREPASGWASIRLPGATPIASCGGERRPVCSTGYPGKP